MNKSVGDMGNAHIFTKSMWGVGVWGVGVWGVGVKYRIFSRVLMIAIFAHLLIHNTFRTLSMYREQIYPRI